MNLTKRQVHYAILFATFLILITPWLQQGIPGTDDYRHHASRLGFVKEQIQDATYSEWVTTSYNGWPFFHFYHPLFYVLSLPIVVFAETIITMKLMTAVAFLIALFGTYYGSKRLIGEDAALVASIAYSLSSHFLFHATVSGALPRLVAIALTPLAMTQFLSALEHKDKKSITLSGILLSALLLTHISVAVPAFIICAIYATYEIIKTKNSKLIKIAALPFIIAVALSSFWLIPLLAEKEHANFSGGNTIETPYLDQTSRTFGITHDGSKFIRSNYFGYSVMILGLLSLLFIKGNEKTNLLKTGVIASAILYFNIGNIIGFVPGIATAITNSTAYFIAPLVFNAVLLAGISAEALGKHFKKHALLYVLIIIVVIDLYPGTKAFSYQWIDQETENFVNPPQLIEAWEFIEKQEGDFSVLSLYGQAGEIYHTKNEFGADWVSCPQCVQSYTYAVHNELWQNITKGIKDDTVFGYLGVKYYVGSCKQQLTNKTVYDNGVACVYKNDKYKPFIQSDAIITIIEKEFDSVEFESTSDTETQAIIQWNYFEPHWHAYIDDKEVPIQKVWPEFISITIPEGTHHVEIEYTTNNTHLFAWFITFLTAALMTYYTRK